MAESDEASGTGGDGGAERPPWWRAPFEEAVLLVAVLGAAVAARARVGSGLDLRDLPGPGGVKIIAALTEGNFQRDRATELIATVLPWFSDAEQAARAVVFAGGALAVVGAYLAARGAAGRAAGVATAGLAAVWSQGVYTSLLIGADAIATGIAWLGAGLALVAGRLGWAGVVVAPLGLLLATAAVPVKVSALPAVAAIAAAPFLVKWKKWPVGIGVAVALAATGLLVKGTLFPEQAAHVGDVARPSLDLVQAGWRRLRGLPDAHPEGLVLVQLTTAAAVGALLPGRGWVGRLVLGVACWVALGFTAETVGDKLRPRFLTATALPVLVLAGCALGVAVDLVRMAAKRWLPRVHPWTAALAALPLLAAIPLWQDTLGFHHAWARVRTAQLGTAPARLPDPPLPWQQHYSRLGGLVFVDTSDQGALDLVMLGKEAPPGGVATVPLRDAREFHMRAGAGLAGKPSVVLDANRCCRPGEGAPACALRLSAELDAAGMDLLIPVQVDRTLRVPRPHQALWRALESSAGALEPVSPWWSVRRATGSGGAAPCGRTPR